MEFWEQLQPTVIAALQYLIPLAATALGVWLRARGIKQAAHDGAVHAAVVGGTAEEQEEIAVKHANERSNWARMTASNTAVRKVVKTHGPGAIRTSKVPVDPEA